MKGDNGHLESGNMFTSIDKSNFEQFKDFFDKQELKNKKFLDSLDLPRPEDKETVDHYVHKIRKAFKAPLNYYGDPFFWLGRSDIKYYLENRFDISIDI